MYVESITWQLPTRLSGVAVKPASISVTYLQSQTKLVVTVVDFAKVFCTLVCISWKRPILVTNPPFPDPMLGGSGHILSHNQVKNHKSPNQHCLGGRGE